MGEINSTFIILTEEEKKREIEEKKKKILNIDKKEEKNDKNIVKIAKNKEIIKVNKSKKPLINLGIKDKVNTIVTDLKEGYQFTQEISKLSNDWKEVMVNKEIYNKNYDTFTLRNIKKEDYGWSGRVYAPWGRSLDELDTLKQYIEYGLTCEFEFNIPQHKQFAMFKIIYPALMKCNAIPFKPYKVKPYEFYAGVDTSGEEIIFNLNITPMVLLAGQQRKGKNGSGESALVSLIHYCSEKEAIHFLFQCAKSDLIKYRKCKQVKTFIMGDFKKMAIAMEMIIKEIERRTTLLSSMMEECEGTNIYDYNLIHKNNQLPYVYIWVDEFMVLMLKSKDKEIQEAKENILDSLERVAEFGGAMGINFVIFHQKPEAKLCPTFLKNMCATRICFGFDDDSCGRIVLGEKYGDLVLKLPRRKAIYAADGKMDILYTTDLQGRIKMFIKDSEVDNRMDAVDEYIKKKKKTNSDSNEKKEKSDGRIKKELPTEQIDFSNVETDIEKLKREALERFYKNNPNAVPYNPNNTNIIIDQTNIPTKTEKPTKSEGRVKKC